MSKYQSVMAVLNKLVEEQKIAGACLMINEGNQTVLNGSVGWQDAEKTRPVTQDTIFQLASMTKPVTAVAALRLVEQGKLDLDAPIAKYLPEYANTDKDDVRVVHLFNHSCGLGMLMHPGMIQAMQLSDVKHDKLADRVTRWKDLTPDFPAGTATGYSPNVGFEILGRIVEVLSGEALDVYFNEHIFGPLGIADITFIPDADQASRRSQMYHDPAAPVVPMPGDFGDLNDYIDASISGYFSGAAGLFGSAAAYNRFVMMLANEGELDGARVLKAETVRKMGSPSNDLLARPGVKWGLGVQVFGKPEETGYYVHDGSYSWSGAYGTHFFVEPAVNRSFTLMLNSDNLGGSESYVSRMIEEAIYKA